MDQSQLICPVCSATSSLLDVVDLNRSCGVAGEERFSLSGVPIYYSLCPNCGFCFAPEMHRWTLEDFSRRIYNDDYVLVDPDYPENRPVRHAEVLRALFPDLPQRIYHLDYGGGNGLLANLLRQSSWASSSYDPLLDTQTSPAHLGKFELITAFEVFEHVPDVPALMADLRTLLTETGLVLFSTVLSDGHIHSGERLGWWYAAPRNGHISLFSKKSLTLLARSNGFHFGSFSSSFHVFFRTVPAWATHVFANK